LNISRIVSFCALAIVAGCGSATLSDEAMPTGTATADGAATDGYYVKVDVTGLTDLPAERPLRLAINLRPADGVGTIGEKIISLPLEGNKTVTEAFVTSYVISGRPRRISFEIQYQVAERWITLAHRHQEFKLGDESWSGPNEHNVRGSKVAWAGRSNSPNSVNNGPEVPPADLTVGYKAE
jgi:hypothetical protein